MFALWIWPLLDNVLLREIWWTRSLTPSGDNGHVRRILREIIRGYGADPLRQRLGKRRVIRFLRNTRPGRRALPALSGASNASRCPGALSANHHSTADPGHDRGRSCARRHLRHLASAQSPRVDRRRSRPGVGAAWRRKHSAAGGNQIVSRPRIRLVSLGPLGDDHRLRPGGAVLASASAAEDLPA